MWIEFISRVLVLRDSKFSSFYYNTSHVKRFNVFSKPCLHEWQFLVKLTNELHSFIVLFLSEVKQLLGKVLYLPLKITLSQAALRKRRQRRMLLVGGNNKWDKLSTVGGSTSESENERTEQTRKDARTIREGQSCLLFHYGPEHSEQAAWTLHTITPGPCKTWRWWSDCSSPLEWRWRLRTAKWRENQLKLAMNVLLWKNA